MLRLMRTRESKAPLRIVLTVAAVALPSCIAPNAPSDALPPPPPPLSADCVDGTPSMLGEHVPGCMWVQRLIDDKTFRESDSVVRLAVNLRDDFRADTGMVAFWRSSELRRAVDHLGEFYSQGALQDSIRFDRLIDHIGATIEWMRGSIKYSDTRFYPARTPHLTWVYYNGAGLFFNPETSVERLVPLLSAPTASTDTLVALANALWSYSVPHRGGPTVFPRWEYDFVFNTGGFYMQPPWQSAMAQGSVMLLFTELFKRTGQDLWRDRAYQVFASYQVSWDEGGIRLPDTTHGYWFEEYSPRVMVWNGSVKALLTLGQFAITMQDSTAMSMYARGIEALKYYTPMYDTGTWTLYSLTQGLNTPAYHAFCIQLLDALYVQSGDPWFKDTADRWRTYTPPS